MVVSLTGFMLCGKSSYGRAAAALRGLDFIDLDDIVSFGRTPAEIIAEEGEEAFRAAESKALEAVLSYGGGVADDRSSRGTLLALGGGTILSEKNRTLLKQKSRVIWIKASLEESVFAPEWADEAAKRPLLHNRTKAEIEALWQERIPLYESVADYTVETAGKTPEQVLEDILAVLDVLDA